jgi:hypothetical protein
MKIFLKIEFLFIFFNSFIYIVFYSIIGIKSSETLVKEALDLVKTILPKEALNLSKKQSM